MKAICKVCGLTLLLCGGAVTVFFKVPPLASNALLTTLHPLIKNMLQTVASKFLASELPFHGWKSPEIMWAGQDLNCMAYVVMGFHRSIFPS
jgi:hypothetical protein